MKKTGESAAPENSCPCGSSKSYALCCQPLHQGEAAANAQALMRSRYSAYALALHDYVWRSWHVSTRPARADIGGDENTRWLGLSIRKHELIDASHERVEFVARYKIAGRAFRLHEISRFVFEDGHWFYLDGEQRD